MGQLVAQHINDNELGESLAKDPGDRAATGKKPKHRTDPEKVIERRAEHRGKKCQRKNPAGWEEQKRNGKLNPPLGNVTRFDSS